MRTWFCKDTQRWVSEIPRAFWLGIYDYKTGEKLYSDDTIYSANPFLRSLNKDLYIKVTNLLNDYSKSEFGRGRFITKERNMKSQRSYFLIYVYVCFNLSKRLSLISLTLSKLSKKDVFLKFLNLLILITQD